MTIGHKIENGVQNEMTNGHKIENLVQNELTNGHKIENWVQNEMTIGHKIENQRVSPVTTVSTREEPAVVVGIEILLTQNENWPG